jgi:predicted transcriptional regulator
MFPKLLVALKTKTDAMLTKEIVYTSLQDMPEEFELDEFIERLIFMQKIKTGLSQIGEGKVKTHKEVKEMVASWRKQRGRSRP